MSAQDVNWDNLDALAVQVTITNLGTRSDDYLRGFEDGAKAYQDGIAAAGLMVVPREPTPRMVNRGIELADIDWRAASEDEALSDDEARRIYRAMIAAALPAAPQEAPR